MIHILKNTFALLLTVALLDGAFILPAFQGPGDEDAHPNCCCAAGACACTGACCGSGTGSLNPAGPTFKDCQSPTTINKIIPVLQSIMPAGFSLLTVPLAVSFIEVPLLPYPGFNSAIDKPPGSIFQNETTGLQNELIRRI